MGRILREKFRFAYFGVINAERNAKQEEIKGRSQSDLTSKKIYCLNYFYYFTTSESGYFGQPSVNERDNAQYDNMDHRNVTEIAAISENKYKFKKASPQQSASHSKMN